MKGFSSLNERTGVAGKFALATLCLASTIAVAADLNGSPSATIGPTTRPALGTVGPLDNTTPASARLLVPDGSSVFQVFGADTDKWFTTEVEPGKTYVIEGIDPYADSGFGSVFPMGVYASDGTTTPPPETQVDCSVGGANDIAPGMGLAGGNNGYRCFVRTYLPTGTTTLGKRAIFIKATKWPTSPGSFQMRVRESTIYGRWTTNGYDFHVELQNTTMDPVCAYVLLYPNASFAGPTATVSVYTVNVPANGANKIIIPNGTVVGADKRGTLHVQACPSAPITLNVGSLHVSTYAFNPVNNQYLYFFPWTANGASSGNSF